MKANDEAASNLEPISTNKADKNEEHEDDSIDPNTKPMGNRNSRCTLKYISYNSYSLIYILTLIVSYRKNSPNLRNSTNFTRTVYEN